MKKCTFIIIMLLSSFCAQAQEDDNSIVKNYHWRCSGEKKSCSLRIDRELLDYYRYGRDHYAYRFEDTPFDGTANYFSFMFSDFDRDLVRSLAWQLCDPNSSTLDNIKTVTTFVQSLPYAYDEESIGQDEYVRYPVETLVDGVGDCEDKVVLLAALYQEMGVDFVLLVIPDHLALGVACDSVKSGQYVQYAGQRYYFVETTTPNWEIGQLPKDMSGMKMEVVPCMTTPVLVSRGMRFESQPVIVGTPAKCSLRLQLQNAGPGVAREVQLLVQILQPTRSGMTLLMEEVFYIPDLDEGESREEDIVFYSLIKDNAVLRTVLSADEVPEQEQELTLHTR